MSSQVQRAGLRIGDRVRFSGAAWTVIGLAGPLVRLAGPGGTPTEVTLAELTADPDFERADVRDHGPVPPVSPLDGLPEAAAAEALWWERHIVEVLRGLPPDAQPGAVPRPEYDPELVSLTRREQAKAAELTAAGRPVTASAVLAATLFAHESAAFGVDVPAGLGGDLCWRRWSGWVVAGVVRPAEETGERRDGLEQQRVESGLLVGGALGVEAGDEPIPVCPGLVLVLGGLPAGLVACPPPAQRRGAGDGDGAMVVGLGGEGGVHREWPGARPETGGAGLVHGQSRVSSATADRKQSPTREQQPATLGSLAARAAGDLPKLRRVA